VGVELLASIVVTRSDAVFLRRKQVLHLVYGTAFGICDWLLAERLLEYSKRYDEDASAVDTRDTNSARALLLAERCSWHRPYGSILFDQAAQLWSQMPETDVFAHVWHNYMICENQSLPLPSA
jgi:hypothetical protein